MNATIGDALVFGLAKITEVIKDVAPEVWRILIRQQYVDGIVTLFVALFFAIIGIWLYKLYKKNRLIDKDGDRIWDDLDDTGPCICIAGIVICVIVTVILIGCGLPQLINPEYYALKSLLNIVRGGF